MSVKGATEGVPRVLGRSRAKLAVIETMLEYRGSIERETCPPTGGVTRLNDVHPPEVYLHRMMQNSLDIWGKENKQGLW